MADSMDSLEVLLLPSDTEDYRPMSTMSQRMKNSIPPLTRMQVISIFHI